MSKYKIIGDYANHIGTAEKDGNTVTMRIPLVTENWNLQHGINTSLCELKKNKVYPTEDGFDILALAVLVYLADTRISRSIHAEESWSREIALELPVFNLDKWLPTSELFTKMLNFLTGDRWIITFIKRKIMLAEDVERKTKYNTVSLFSGGMDSLIGTINHLEHNHKVALISHAGEGHTKDAQKNLLTDFGTKYPDSIPSYYNLYMTFRRDSLLEGGTENSTRSRSFLFIAFGIFALTGMIGVNVLQVPENGLIALNVPLDTLRIGSHSTRTTHPFYMNLWNKALSELSLPYSVDNPYWNKTKGEMADECLNKEFLRDVISKSTSCSSPHKSRWERNTAKHCGYCVPCLIRRAAIHKAFGFENDPTTYWKNSVNELVELHAGRKGEHLRSFQVAIKRIKDNPHLRTMLIHKSGKLECDEDYINQLAEIYYRGLLEVDSFISAYVTHEDSGL